MKPIESTGLIKIITVPDGEAPLNVRSAWVGIELPCDPHVGYPDHGLDRGVVSNQEVSQNRRGFSVPQDQAIEALGKVRPAAAGWWLAHGYPKDGEYFGFAEHEAEIISGVTAQRMIEVTEEMMGHVDR